MLGASSVMGQRQSERVQRVLPFPQSSQRLDFDGEVMTHSNYKYGLTPQSSFQLSLQSSAKRTMQIDVTGAQHAVLPMHFHCLGCNTRFWMQHPLKSPFKLAVNALDKCPLVVSTLFPAISQAVSHM